MALWKSVSDIFRPVQQVNFAQNNTTVGTAPAAGTSQEITNNANQPSNPMDEMKALWQNDPNFKAPVDPLAGPLLNTDVGKLNAAAGKLNLVGNIDADLLARAMSGQDANAFIQVLNTVGQQAVVTSSQLTASTVEQATARNNQRMLQVIPTQVRNAQIASVEAENPALNHPAAAPFVAMVRDQVQMKNPGLSPQQVVAEAERVISGFAGAVTAAPQEAAQLRAASNSTDWDQWAGIADSAS